MFEGVDWNKWIANFSQAALIIGSAYVATNPKWVWLVPAMQAIGGFTPPPNFKTAPAPKP